MNPLVLGVLAAVTLYFLGYFFRERSLRQLNVTQAGTLVLTIRPIRVRFTLIYMASIAAWVIIIYLFPRQKPTLLLISILWLLTCIGFAQLIGWRALGKCALPPDFFRNYRAAAALTFLAYSALFGAVIATGFIHSKG